MPIPRPQPQSKTTKGEHVEGNEVRAQEKWHSLPPIRIRIAGRPSESAPAAPQSNEEQFDKRQDFWRRLKTADPQHLGYRTVESLETLLTKNFARAIKQRLVAEVIGVNELPTRLDDYQFLDRILDVRLQSDADRARVISTVERYVHDRRETLDRLNASDPEKVAAAQSLRCVVRIADYQSLNLELSMGPLDSLAKVFDSDPFNLKLFLEEFVAAAFADILGVSAANAHTFDITIPSALADAISHVNSAPQLATPPVAAPTENDTPPKTALAGRELAREQARTIWNKAQPLLPLFLAFAVVWYALQELNRIADMRERALTPILDHQLKVLEQDRLRFTIGTDSVKGRVRQAGDTSNQKSK